jgi:glycosyltransferase involved in cell wall biosynthesis
VDVTVATTNAAGSSALDVPLVTPVIDDGVVYHYFSRTVPGSWKFSWPLTRWLFAHARRYDVVHVHALFSYATIPGCRAAARAPVPYVLRPLGTLSEWSLARRSWKKRPYYALLERSHLESAAAIHVTSDAEAADIERLGFGNRVAVIPLGVDVAAEPPQRQPVVPNAPLRVLFLSRLHEKKNIPLLLRALAGMPNGARPVQLTVAGDGEPKYRSELEAITRSLGLGARVEFVGHLDGAAKRDAFENADVFVLPSAHENFGIAVAEALAAGLPVIVTPGVALAPNVADAGAGLVVDATDDGVARALRWAVDNPAALREMGERAWWLARRDFSWDTSCARLAALYSELASSGAKTVRRA